SEDGPLLHRAERPRQTLKSPRHCVPLGARGASMLHCTKMIVTRRPSHTWGPHVRLRKSARRALFFLVFVGCQMRPSVLLLPFALLLAACSFAHDDAEHANKR